MVSLPRVERSEDGALLGTPARSSTRGDLRPEREVERRPRGTIWDGPGVRTQSDVWSVSGDRYQGQRPTHCRHAVGPPLAGRRAGQQNLVGPVRTTRGTRRAG